MKVRKMVEIYDSVRETEQSSLLSGALTAEEILNYVKILADFGVPWIECPWPVPKKGNNDLEIEKQEKAQQFYQLVRNKSFVDKVVVFGSTMEKTAINPERSEILQNLVATGLKNFCIFGKSWKAQVFRVLKTSLNRNLTMIEQSVRFLKKQNGKVFYDAEHFFDGFKTEANGNLKNNYAVKTVLAAIKGGADAIIFCDTNGGTLTEEVELILSQVTPLLGTIPWGVHFHDDEGLAKANTLKAVDLGATYLQVTTLGHSERVGMPRLTDLVPTLVFKKGIKCKGINELKGLTELAKKVAEQLGEPIRPYLPYVGTSAFSHKAGTHTKCYQLQEHIDPAKVGNKRFRQISGLIGPNGVWSALKDLGLYLPRNSPLIGKILEEIKKMDAQGIHIGSALGSFGVLALRLSADYVPPFIIKNVIPSSYLSKNNEWRHESRADIKIYLDNRRKPIRVWEISENGPVDAINNVLVEALSQKYPIIKNVTLVDYNVRILKNRGKGTASTVRVNILGSTPYGQFETFAISGNILLASALALTDLYELVILLKRKRHKEK